MTENTLPTKPDNTSIAAEAEPIVVQRLSRNYLAELRQSPKGLFGAVVVLIIALLAIFAPLLAPHSTTAQAIDARFAQPFFVEDGSSTYPFGGDNLGRDTLSRALFGTRISMGVAALVISVSVSIGAVLGCIAGYYGGIIDAVIMRLADFQLSFPFILVAIIFMAIFGPGFWSLVAAFIVALWVNYARLARGEALKIRELEFVQASKAIGVSDWKIITGHVLPNAVPALLVLGTLDFAWVIIFESALSFLGLGIQPPTPSWGVMLSEARNYLYESYWMTVFPGALLFMAVIGINLLGDWLRDTFDPKLLRL